MRPSFLKITFQYGLLDCFSFLNNTILNAALMEKTHNQSTYGVLSPVFTLGIIDLPNATVKTPSQLRSDIKKLLLYI